MRAFVCCFLAACLGCATGAIADDTLNPPDGGGGGEGGGGEGGCTAMCGGVCTDTKTDPKNCGKCGTACPMGASCVLGACQCASPQMKCGTSCVDTSSDPQNCGKCGVSCGGDGGVIMGGGTWGCAMGACKIMCPAPKVECSGACVDTQTDHDNCGTCGMACAGTETCTQGLCCTTGLTVCSMMCTDTQTDANNCGMCGKQCSGNTPYCNGGACTAGVLYSKMFTGSQVPPAQNCTDWNSFRASLTGSYSSITVFGSNDMTGRTCTGSTANQLCNALRTGQALSVTCNGNAWYAGLCTTGIEISANGQCTCSSQYSVRPCINHQDWGGVATTSCGAPSQTLSVLCQ